MGAAGLLLTGGASRRMGRPKAAIRSGRTGEGLGLAERTAAILASVTHPALEIGPGYTSLEHVEEEPPGAGPLAALARGALELRTRGWDGPAVVIATDMPMIEAELISWLAGHPDPRSVVPVVGDRSQPLCARYRTGDLSTAITLAGNGMSSMMQLLDAIDPLLAGPDGWAAAGIRESWFSDVDDPGELAAYRAGAQ